MNKTAGIFQKLFLLVSTIFAASCFASDPMDDVFSMLGQGGTRSGVSEIDGYYVVAMGTSNRSSQAKGIEEARIEALRQLNEMINGVTTSGSTHVSMSYTTLSEGANKQEFSEERFIDVVDTHFNGNLSAVKMLHSGQFKSEHFVALVITESDVAQIGRLQPTSVRQDTSDVTTAVETVATFTSAEKSVEAKGLASMKSGEAKAREEALLDAIRNAVQQAQGVMLSGKSGQFNDAVSMAISTKTQGYVSGYEVLDEDIERGQYYVVLVADVNQGKLLHDANFYLDVLGNARFSIQSANKQKSQWLIDELQKLGFNLTENQSNATHTFRLQQEQRAVEDHKGAKGVETSLSIDLVDNHTSDIILSVVNEPMKTRIYVKPVNRAKQVSEHQAYKQLGKKMGLEVIQSLAAHTEQGVVYPIIINNANRNDTAIFRHVLDNATEGSVENWQWDKSGKTMTLNYRFSGSLSHAFDQGLDEIYRTFKVEGKGRRPHLKALNDRDAVFEIL
ncbi:flagellar assembly protein T N-terminal domain-containing protein [Vibrio europaeus]|uniref:flagellar assembly protein T N-terminal domain-containing protein n=1 Tax=Vibrio europaeus TaxID=300876 RepID=UPI00148B58AD|nr:flagellar assembly protein T N-terminal domain-containing protein [Vibrio europaeus]MDC5839395.1 flagellar assembly protein T N-terminal domain-containing protein [Vibrio europaeus]NOH23667.1 hypothetical protein [Vibrio europaeus]